MTVLHSAPATAEFHRISAKLKERQDPSLAGRRAQEFRNILRGLVFCKCGSTFRYHAQKSLYVDLVCHASTVGQCSYATPGKGIRHRYALVESIFLAYQSLIPFHQIIVKTDDIKALEKEHEGVSGLIILKEKALGNNFAILEQSSESAQKFPLMLRMAKPQLATQIQYLLLYPWRLQELSATRSLN